MTTVAPPRLYRRGVLAPEETLLDRLTFPTNPELDAIGVMEETLRNVVKHRYGAVVTAQKGHGKTFGLEEAVDNFEAGEALKASREEGYEQALVTLLPPMHAGSRSELIRALHKHVFGTTGLKSRAGGDPGMLAEVIEAWVSEGVVACIFDEADRIEGTALDVLRDIMPQSAAAARARARTAAAGGARRKRARGMGVLVVGTPKLAERLRDTAEYGQRWIRDREITALTSDALPRVYEGLLPCLKAEAARRGPHRWHTFVTTHVAPDIAGSIRRVEYHLREYVTLCLDNLETPPTSVEDVPFVEEFFLDAVKALAGSSPFSVTP
ncbi:MAG: ATP-binding protein [Gemmatimonadaceae bacterium]|jgi:hypothetical protein|nr:ATP-binding protein [Gemmatimonadaceae bacterium]